MKNDNPYKEPVKTAIIFQGLSGLLTFAIDSQEPFFVWFYCMVGFWCGFNLIKYRRDKNPTKTDLFLIKWSFIPLYFLAIFMSVYIWILMRS